MTDQEPEVPAVFDALGRATPEGRTDLDRYREFRRVFLGSDEGQRVLQDLLTKCGVNRLSLRPGDDPMHVGLREGRRDVGLWLIGTLTVEPGEKPRQANRKKDTV